MIYLISTDSIRIQNNEIKKIVKDDTFKVFNMHKCTLKDIAESLSYYSMDKEKYNIITNCGLFGSEKQNEDDINTLINIINKTTDDIIFVTNDLIDLRKKQTKLIKENGKIINIPKLDKKLLREEIINYLNKYNYSIDYDTSFYIVNNCNDNLDILYNELDKIILYYSRPCKVNMLDVKNIIGKRLEDNSFHFVSLVIEKNLKGAIDALRDLQREKVEEISLVILLAREYRLMYYVKKLYNKMSINEIIKYLNLRDWQINKLYTNSLKYKDKELLEYIYNLSIIDINIKKGLYDKSTILYSFLMDVC